MLSKTKVLSIQHLRVTIADKAVIDDVSFDIHAGETVALVGESGSGKSMTALAIMQLLPLAATMDVSSTILFEGVDLLSQSEIAMRKIRGKKIGLIFQEAITALNPVLTIQQQIEEVLRAHTTCRKKQRQQRILDLLLEVGIVDPQQVAKSYPHQLSGGMKQRAMIAQALAGQPDLLIADEPTTALDVTIQAQVLSLLQTIQQRHGMSVLFITHDLGVVNHIADRVVVMKDGKLVEEKRAADFFAKPEHVYSQQLFNSIPCFANRPKPVAAEETATLLSATDIKIYYPIKKGVLRRTVGYVKAVDGVTFRLQQGKTLALVGESGSGKTTTGMGIIDLLTLTDGQVSLQGASIRKDCQIIFQDPYSSMNPRMMVGDIIVEGMKAHHMPVTAEKISELLTMVGLQPEHQHRYPHEFSGGQRQRICIARALA
ncbi:MAG: ABC transporter ATP-binding protein, partial [Coxiellaceae bacterium]|nr:ABC transporter ATP-binding protein [Coxiellaceae bacterium]